MFKEKLNQEADYLINQHLKDILGRGIIKITKKAQHFLGASFVPFKDKGEPPVVVFSGKGYRHLLLELIAKVLNDDFFFERANQLFKYNYAQDIPEIELFLEEVMLTISFESGKILVGVQKYGITKESSSFGIHKFDSSAWTIASALEEAKEKTKHSLY